MYISLHHTIVLLFITAMLFYTLPKCNIKWQILVVLVWLYGISWLMFINHKTEDNKIFIPSKNHLIEV